jgi:hypothetical protein
VLAACQQRHSAAGEFTADLHDDAQAPGPFIAQHPPPHPRRMPQGLQRCRNGFASQGPSLVRDRVQHRGFERLPCFGSLIHSAMVTPSRRVVIYYRHPCLGQPSVVEREPAVRGSVDLVLTRHRTTIYIAFKGRGPVPSIKCPSCAQQSDVRDEKSYEIRGKWEGWPVCKCLACGAGMTFRPGITGTKVKPLPPALWQRMEESWSRAFGG